MDWNKGYTSESYAEFVDPITWRGIERFEITGGKVVRKETGLRQSADITCTDSIGSDRWVRLWMNVKQDGDADHQALFTGLASTPDDDIDGTRFSYDVQLYSVLRPADKHILPLGWYAAKGALGANVVKELLSIGPAPVYIDGDSPMLSQNIIAESNETNLSMADKILDSMGWRLVIDGLGNTYIKAKASEPVASYDPLENDSIEPEVSLSRDWFDCPNVFRAIKDDVYADARDDSPDSQLSTVNRGYEVWDQEKDCSLNDNESLADYSKRRLKELQEYIVEVSYTRRFNPVVNVTEIISLNYPRQGVVGNYKVTSQNINIESGGRTAEEVVKV